MLVVNPSYDSITEDWFDPKFWGDNAQPVATGGRGSAWFIGTGQDKMVLRHYRRGGVVARISERYYVFVGWQKTRSVWEFELTKKLYDLGLPVPEPLAAFARKGLMLYQAAILIRRIPEAVPLSKVENLTNEPLWREVGKTIRRFHDVGLDHVDLNCDNILVSGNSIYLIDFDRCRLRSINRGAWWRKANLQRLLRSVNKRLCVMAEHRQSELWAELLRGYHDK